MSQMGAGTFDILSSYIFISFFCLFEYLIYFFLWIWYHFPWRDYM